VWTPREIESYNPWERGADSHQLFKLFGLFSVQPAENETGSTVDTFEGRLDDSFGRVGVVKLGREANLKGRDPVLRGVLTHLPRHSSDGCRAVEKTHGEGEAGEGLSQSHVSIEEKVFRDIQPPLGGELGDRARAQGAVEVAMEI
jgi:hypothetical protein